MELYVDPYKTPLKNTRYCYNNLIYLRLQKELFERAPQLTREYIRNVRRSNILGKAGSPQNGTNEVMAFLNSSESELSQQIGRSMYQKVFGVGEQIDKLFNIADSIEKCEALKTTLQKLIEIKLFSTRKKMNE